LTGANSDNADNSGIFNSMQEQAMMVYPKAGESFLQVKYKANPSSTSFDLTHHDRLHNGANSNRGNGRNTTLLVSESKSSNVSIPRQIQDTGQALSKGVPLMFTAY